MLVAGLVRYLFRIERQVSHPCNPVALLLTDSICCPSHVVKISCYPYETTLYLRASLDRFVHNLDVCCSSEG